MRTKAPQNGQSVVWDVGHWGAYLTHPLMHRGFSRIPQRENMQAMTELLQQQDLVDDESL